MFNSYVPLSCTFRVELAVESPMEIPCSYPQEIWHIPGYSIILSGLFHCHYHDLMNYIHLYPFICPDTWDILSSHERSFILPWVFPGSFFFHGAWHDPVMVSPRRGDFFSAILTVNSLEEAALRIVASLAELQRYEPWWIKLPYMVNVYVTMERSTILNG